MFRNVCNSSLIFFNKTLMPIAERPAIACVTAEVPGLPQVTAEVFGVDHEVTSA